MDAHISVIADLKTMGLDIDITDWTLSNHAWVFGKERDNPKHINADTFKSINHDMISKFQEEYDNFLSEFDGFIVCHVPAFAMIYEKYNRPIIWINSCRFDLPFCWSRDMSMRSDFIACLQRLNLKKLLYPISNNKADQLYTLKSTNIKTEHIPSLCLYTKIKYEPIFSTFLCYNGTLQSNLITNRQDIGNFDWNIIGKYKGIIHFPYEISTMSMFEHFSAGIPLFFPSKSFINECCKLQTLNSYWGEDLPIKELRDINTWINLSDIYSIFNSPNTYYFNSIPHLFELLQTFTYNYEDSYRTNYIQTIKTRWETILLNIQTNKFRTQHPLHLSYNRIPLIANNIVDVSYDGSGVYPQHQYITKHDIKQGDFVFIKTDLLDTYLKTHVIDKRITLITGVSDMSPSVYATSTILSNKNIIRWIGCNIRAFHSKIIKIPIGVGEPTRINGCHSKLYKLHVNRINWNDKLNDLFIPYHNNTYQTRNNVNGVKLDFDSYMKEINKHKFVLCMRGNGIDTHRVCETLLMGSVPVILTSELDNMYSQFPCLIVKSIDHIDLNSYKWNAYKYKKFLDIFWLKDINTLFFNKSAFVTFNNINKDTLGSIKEINSNTDLFLYSDYADIQSPPHETYPYGFKPYAVEHMKNIGYRFVIWVDSCIQGRRSIDTLIPEIEKRGVYIQTDPDWKCGQWANDKALSYFNKTRDEAMNIPAAYASIVAFDFSNPVAHELLRLWKQACDDGIFNGEWNNDAKTESTDDRCKGHRHDQTCLELISDKLGIERGYMLVKKTDPSNYYFATWKCVDSL
jgi:hypothetical protein